MNQFWMEKTDDNSSENSEAAKSANIEVSNNDIYFYGGVTSERMLRLLKTIRDKEIELLTNQMVMKMDKPPAIHLHIQSYGGSAHAGFSMYDHLKALTVPLYTYVEGAAASAATMLSLAGDKRFIQPNSYMMIHQVSYKLWGSHTFENMKDDIKNAQSIMESIIRLYRNETKLTNEMLNDILKHDLYFDADKCLKYGLVDAIN